MVQVLIPRVLVERLMRNFDAICDEPSIQAISPSRTASSVVRATCLRMARVCEGAVGASEAFTDHG